MTKNAIQKTSYVWSHDCHMFTALASVTMTTSLTIPNNNKLLNHIHDHLISSTYHKYSLQTSIVYSLPNHHPMCYILSNMK